MLFVFMTLWLSGVKNADEAELRQVASEPVDLNVYNVNDFPLLSKLVARLVHILCGRIEDRGLVKRNLLLLICLLIFTAGKRGANPMLLCLQEWSPQQTQHCPTQVQLISASQTWAQKKWSFTGLILPSQSNSTEWFTIAQRVPILRRSDLFFHIHTIRIR